MQHIGYNSREYALAFQEFGQPLLLKQAKGWVLKRPIAQSGFFDGMGLYPMFRCENWAGLADDFQTLQSELVSLVLVTDVFAQELRLEWLQTLFPDLAIPFKNHYVVDLSQPLEQIVRARFRTYARKALKQLTIEQRPSTDDLLKDWIQLYQNLIKRHQIRGITTFSQTSFYWQFRTPGLHIFVAQWQKQTVAMQLWFGDGNYGYYHLGASNSLGYQFRASYGLMWFALNFFKQAGYHMLDLGASAGLREKKDGLAFFKSGWSNLQRPTYLCGRIFQPEQYWQLSTRLSANTNEQYFPAYRTGEFAR